MKRIGLIGGVSWAATSAYYHAINTMVQAQLGGNCSADMVVRSLNMQHALDHMDRPGKVEEIVLAAATDLAAAGAEVIALASLTGHRYVSCLEDFHVPFVSIERPVAAELAASGLGRAGVFATSTALRDPVLMARLAPPGAAPPLLPPPAAMADLDAIIFGELAHQRLPDDALARLNAIAHGLVEQGATAILLGTTEFSRCTRALTLPVPVYDATALHCQELVRHCLGASPVRHGVSS